MSSSPKLPWFAVNEMMDETYRGVVVRLAMQHLAQAPQELQAMARTSFRGLSVRGFRSFEKADPRSAALAVIAHMKSNAAVSTAVICLWGDAMPAVIDSLRQAAEARGLHLQPEWTWKQAQEGYITSDQATVLEQVCDELAEGKAKPDSDHLRLAVLWLSGAVIPEEPAASAGPEATT
jgi:hypothetical protein